MSEWQADQNSGTVLTPEILVPRLGNHLVEKGIITETELKIALDLQQKKINEGENLLIGQILIEMNLIDKITLDSMITEQILQLRSALQSANEQLEKRVEQRTSELQKALEKLSELDRMKSNFISNISHELRTPLTHIKGYLDLMRIGDLGTLDEIQMEAVKVMSRSSSRLEQLIDELIMLSSVEHGKLDFRLEEFNILSLCVSIIQQIKEVIRHEEKNIQLELVVPETDLLLVIADKKNISWVIQQLLENARKFTPNNGQIRIIIETDDKNAHISIEDTGIGIPQERINEIFEPFHQLDSDSTRKYGGTGLGLTLVRNILNAHGSQIFVSSKPDVGSRFKFSLKLSENNAR